ncbi:hypothetical protein BJ508DRAFT_21210 [Ascobolus immersus RN42]|uniref:Uncharacterized protein n=1 Tax=Ascobolus immersus RN42 TaxID=1160509 RepID=A0A3N4IK10_ASCIM|nr:hypothetical protein BJ508DRAFT_21210 [Ascobolus immersus RN42]
MNDRESTNRALHPPHSIRRRSTTKAAPLIAPPPNRRRDRRENTFTSNIYDNIFAPPHPHRPRKIRPDLVASSDGARPTKKPRVSLCLAALSRSLQLAAGMEEEMEDAELPGYFEEEEEVVVEVEDEGAGTAPVEEEVAAEPVEEEEVESEAPIPGEQEEGESALPDMLESDDSNWEDWSGSGSSVVRETPPPVVVGTSEQEGWMPVLQPRKRRRIGRAERLRNSVGVEPGASLPPVIPTEEGGTEEQEEEDGEGDGEVPVLPLTPAASIGEDQTVEKVKDSEVVESVEHPVVTPTTDEQTAEKACESEVVEQPGPSPAATTTSEEQTVEPEKDNNLEVIKRSFNIPPGAPITKIPTADGGHNYRVAGMTIWMPPPKSMRQQKVASVRKDPSDEKDQPVANPPATPTRKERTADAEEEGKNTEEVEPPAPLPPATPTRKGPPAEVEEEGKNAEEVEPPAPLPPATPTRKERPAEVEKRKDTEEAEPPAPLPPATPTRKEQTVALEKKDDSEVNKAAVPRQRLTPRGTTVIPHGAIVNPTARERAQCYQMRVGNGRAFWMPLKSTRHRTEDLSEEEEEGQPVPDSPATPTRKERAKVPEEEDEPEVNKVAVPPQPAAPRREEQTVTNVPGLWMPPPETTMQQIEEARAKNAAKMLNNSNRLSFSQRLENAKREQQGLPPLYTLPTSTEERALPAQVHSKPTRKERRACAEKRNNASVEPLQPLAPATPKRKKQRVQDGPEKENVEPPLPREALPPATPKRKKQRVVSEKENVEPPAPLEALPPATPRRNLEKPVQLSPATPTMGSEKESVEPPVPLLPAMATKRRRDGEAIMKPNPPKANTTDKGTNTPTIISPPPSTRQPSASSLPQTPEPSRPTPTPQHIAPLSPSSQLREDVELDDFRQRLDQLAPPLEVVLAEAQKKARLYMLSKGLSPSRIETLENLQALVSVKPVKPDRADEARRIAAEARRAAAEARAKALAASEKRDKEREERRKRRAEKDVVSGNGKRKRRP